jgi:hypothetical protein
MAKWQPPERLFNLQLPSCHSGRDRLLFSLLLLARCARVSSTDTCLRAQLWNGWLCHFIFPICDGRRRGRCLFRLVGGANLDSFVMVNPSLVSRSRFFRRLQKLFWVFVAIGLVHSCTWVYWCKPRIHVSSQTALSPSKLWKWATMVELGPVAHLRSQLAALHMSLSCVKQKSVTSWVVVLRQHQSQVRVLMVLVAYRQYVPGTVSTY